MPVRPKHALPMMSDEVVPASRQFTDREEPTKSFRQALNRKTPDEYQILVYYGVGGIGKSRLLAELQRKLENEHPDSMQAFVDFREVKLRHSVHTLIRLRETFRKKYGVKFMSFDLANAVHWSKVNPEQSMKREAIDLPFMEEGNYVGELVGMLGNVPLFEWIPKTIKLLGGLMSYKDSSYSWHGEGKRLLEKLKDMQPMEIEDLLSGYWAADVTRHLQYHGHQPIVVFLDTFEALGESSDPANPSSNNGKWVWKLAECLPEALWVIGGREKLRWPDDWDDYVEQHIMGGLSEKDCEMFLQSCGIEDEDIRSKITDGSAGLPYYLDLMVDTYQLLLRRGDIPSPADFSKTPEEVLERFLSYMRINERETLKMLSFPRRWDAPLFRKLVNDFNTGYPGTAHEQLGRFSFVSRTEVGEWTMHAVMRQSLQEQTRSEDRALFAEAHAALFRHYDRQLEQAMPDRMGAEEQDAFRESFYHGTLCRTPGDMVEWFLKRGRLLQAGGQFQFVHSFHDECMSYLAQSENPEGVASVYRYYAGIYLLTGDYAKSAEYYKQAMNAFREYGTAGSGNDPKRAIGACGIDLAEIMIQTADYDGAYAYLAEAASLYESYGGVRNGEYYGEYALLLVRLGKLNIRFSRYSDTESNYKAAIAACEAAEAMADVPPVIWERKALAYEKLGEFYDGSNPEAQRECCLMSIRTYEQALSRKQDIGYVRTLTNLGLAYKRLAESYSTKTESADKSINFRQSLSVYEDVLTQAPNFIDALEKKGHAAVCFMIVQTDLGLYTEAEELFKQAIDAFGKALELSPRQASSRNRIASAYRELATLQWKTGRFEEADASIRRSLSVSDEMLEISPEYVYVYNTMGKTWERWGRWLIELQQPRQAAEALGKALEYYGRMLLRSPDLKETLAYREGVKALMSRLR
ncbi:hypothetical protein [Cohnella sp. GCM10027633]|uniref:hypothetical protein n=1 Tax=unclassified Cohnella TaxID=2636738 RepID=UPI00362DA241